MRRSAVSPLLMVSLSLVAGSAPADSIDVSGQQPWEACGYCHNLDGISLSPRFPNLAGQRRAYLIAQLRAFRGGGRINDDGMMRSIAQGLSEHDIDVVADYFSALPAAVLPAADDSAAAALYATGDSACAVPACSACHGDSALGQALIPRLAGQQLSYLGKQLDDFAEGRRKGVFEHAFLRCLGEPRRRALAVYVSGLGAKTTAASALDAHLNRIN